MGAPPRRAEAIYRLLDFYLAGESLHEEGDPPAPEGPPLHFVGCIGGTMPPGCIV